MKVEITLNFFFNLSETRDQRLKMIRHNNKMSCYWLLWYNVMVLTPSMASCQPEAALCYSVEKTVVHRSHQSYRSHPLLTPHQLSCKNGATLSTRLLTENYHIWKV